MPVASWKNELSAPREDGLVTCRETVILKDGQELKRAYSAPKDFDFARKLAETVTAIKANLATREFENTAKTKEPMPRLLEQTVTQFLAKWRIRYRDTHRAEAAAMAQWTLEQIRLGKLTEAQVMRAFGLGTDVEKWRRFKLRLEQQARAWKAFTDILGED